MQSQHSKFFALLLAFAVISCIFVGQSMAGKNKGSEDIILYNGNIVLRGKGKGKGGNIVVANSPQMDMMPYFGDWGSGFGRRK